MQSLPTAFFLACSWFWCIGGFFPVLLEREFGWIALPFFLLFNVVGAALFSLVWRDGARREFRQRFLKFVEGFSALVIGYHIIFMTWISVMLNDLSPLLGFIAVTFLFWLMRRRLTALSIPVFGLTVGLFAILLLLPVPEVPTTQTQYPFLHQVIPLALGFLLAPYFDLTFHRAYADSLRPRLSFTLGFGILFAALLAGMLFSTGQFAQLLNRPSLSQTPVLIVVALLVLQTGFTTAAHLREISCSQWLRSPLLPLSLLAVTALGTLHLVADSSTLLTTELVGELLYRSFVFAVGVIFPVILMFDGLSRYSVAVMAFLTPCYGLGFLVGGAYAPFLTVGIAGLAIAYWMRPQFRSFPLSRHPR